MRADLTLESIVSHIEFETTDPPSKGDPANGRKTHHRLILLLSGCVLLLSFLLEVVPEGRVAIRGFEAYPLPHSCSMRLLFGQGCAGCGMTRGFIHLANGRLHESLAVHRLAWLFFAALLVQFPYRLAALWRGEPHPLGKRWPALCGWALLGLLLVNWIAVLAK
jgi:hypothetical protein